MYEKNIQLIFYHVKIENPKVFEIFPLESVTDSKNYQKCVNTEYDHWKIIEQFQKQCSYGMLESSNVASLNCIILIGDKKRWDTLFTISFQNQNNECEFNNFLESNLNMKMKFGIYEYVMSILMIKTELQL